MNTFKEGWGVSIVLKSPVQKLLCWVGEIQAVDERGIRITTIDWVTGMMTGMDWWFPWSEIAAIEVATESHPGWDPGLTQRQIQQSAEWEIKES